MNEGDVLSESRHQLLEQIALAAVEIAKTDRRLVDLIQAESGARVCAMVKPDIWPLERT